MRNHPRVRPKLKKLLEMFIDSPCTISLNRLAREIDAHYGGVYCVRTAFHVRPEECLKKCTAFAPNTCFQIFGYNTGGCTSYTLKKLWREGKAKVLMKLIQFNAYLETLEGR